jgi:hypothetical protein
MSHKRTLYCRPVIILLQIQIGIVGGGVKLGPHGTTATNRPTVPAPGDYDDGEIGGMIGRGNRNTRRKPAPVLQIIYLYVCLSVRPSIHPFIYL